MLIPLTFLFLIHMSSFGKGDECPIDSKCEVKQNSKGENHGEEKCFSHDKKLLRVAHYKNGILHGTWECFDKNGRAKISQEYVDGKLEGLEKRWNDSVQLYEEC